MLLSAFFFHPGLQAQSLRGIFQIPRRSCLGLPWVPHQLPRRRPKQGALAPRRGTATRVRARGCPSGQARPKYSCLITFLRIARSIVADIIGFESKSSANAELGMPIGASGVFSSIADEMLPTSCCRPVVADQLLPTRCDSLSWVGGRKVQTRLLRRDRAARNSPQA